MNRALTGVFAATQSSEMEAIDLTGKSREQIERALAHKRRNELLDLIFSLITFEPHFSVATFAQRRQLTRATVLRLIRERILHAHLPTGNGYRIPLSAIRDFDRRTAVCIAEPVSPIA